MTKWRVIANRLRCLRTGHDYKHIPMPGTQNNFFVCSRCGEPGWMA